jgi:YidC/Oxa1 family membrane protein insertase
LAVLVGGPLSAAAASPDASIAPSPAPPVLASASPAATLVASPSAAPEQSPGPQESAAPCPLPTPDPSATPLAPGTTPAPRPLCPAHPTANPLDLIAWLFNPIFQTLFLGLVLFYSVTHDIGIAIILLTLLIKTILIPISRAQIVSQRRMQMLQPEIRSIQQKFKGNRTKISEETMRLYRERNINPASGCLPSILQLGLLLPIYSVISTGLAAPDISSALQFLGQPLGNIISCADPGTLNPCLNTTVWWLGNLNAHVSEVLLRLPVLNFPVSGLALVAAFLQLIQTRMATPRTTDPQAGAQQRILLVLPLISIVYGAVLPSGLFIYWIVFTAYSIVQQYLIAGWGSLFPLFGWTPGFAQGHQPRFPVSVAPIHRPDSGDGRSSSVDTSRSATDRAAGTIRPVRQRARTSRRGRRR